MSLPKDYRAAQKAVQHQQQALRELDNLSKSIDIMAFQWYVFLLLNPVWNIVNSFSELQRSLAAMERVFEILDMPQDKPLAGELQIWNLAQGKLFTKLPGTSSEVFGAVALDKTGRRVAGVRGIAFGQFMSGTLQNSLRLISSTNRLTVNVWTIRTR